MKVQTIDPYADLRNRQDVLIATAPRTRVTLTKTPAETMEVGWALFWRGVRDRILRRSSVIFWLED